MDIGVIAGVISAAAVFLKEPIQGLTERAVIDAYEKLKRHVLDKYRTEDLSDALRKLEQKPDSEARKILLQEELAGTNVNSDSEIAEMVEHLSQLLSQKGASMPVIVVQQMGRGNRMHVAGRDLIITEKHTKKVGFTPDETHITPAQGKKIRDLVKKLALKLTSEEGKPNFQEAYGSLYRHLNINSYREIKQDQYEAAVSFLRQQGAINRSRLKRVNPQAYRNDLYGPIWAKQKEMGWEKSEVYRFAFEKLALKKPITTLKKLGPLQLKRLYAHMMRCG